MSTCFRSPNACPLDYSRGGGFGGIKRYLDAQYPQFTEHTVRTIYARARSLKTKPCRGRPGRRSGTRELPLAPLPYIIVYAVQPEAVEILHVYHGSQDWQ